MIKPPLKCVAAICTTALLSSCATNPDGKRILNFVDSKQLSEMGVAAFTDLKTKGKVSQDPATQAYVSCVANKLIAELPPQFAAEQWEVVVFEDETPNAFALPGGKIGVHTGILKITQSEDELAAIMGHELSHVTYQHGGQRISQGALVSAAGQAVELYMGRDGEPPNQAVVAALGVASQVGVVLPFSRKHETEADKQGQRLMARAGYNPEAAASLWRNMIAANGGKAPPEWMSTHPDSENRMERLNTSAPDLQPLAETARGLGKGRPCR